MLEKHIIRFPLSSLNNFLDYIASLITPDNINQLPFQLFINLTYKAENKWLKFKYVAFLQLLETDNKFLDKINSIALQCPLPILNKIMEDPSISCHTSTAYSLYRGDITKEFPPLT